MVTQVANIRAGSEPQLIWPQTLLSLHCTIFMRRSEVKLLSCVQLFATPWTVAYQSPLSMGLSRQEYWSGLHFLLQGIFPTQGSNPGLLHCRQTRLPSEPPGKSQLVCRDSEIKFEIQDQIPQGLCPSETGPSCTIVSNQTCLHNIYSLFIPSALFSDLLN